MSEIAIQEKLNGMEWGRTRLNGNSIGFENTFDYCYWIRGISETTGASSDVYCQSINDNHNGTSCDFYVESVQVKHSGELGRKHRKREWYIADWGERERT